MKEKKQEDFSYIKIEINAWYNIYMKEKNRKIAVLHRLCPGD